MPGSKEEDFERNNAFSLYDLYGHALAQVPLPRGHEIYNYGRPGLFDLCLRVEKTVFKQFYTFYPKITHSLGGGHEIYKAQFFLRRC